MSHGGVTCGCPGGPLRVPTGVSWGLSPGCAMGVSSGCPRRCPGAAHTTPRDVPRDRPESPKVAPRGYPGTSHGAVPGGGGVCVGVCVPVPVPLPSPCGCGGRRPPPAGRCGWPGRRGPRSGPAPAPWPPRYRCFPLRRGNRARNGERRAGPFLLSFLPSRGRSFPALTGDDGGAAAELVAVAERRGAAQAVAEQRVEGQ